MQKTFPGSFQVNSQTGREQTTFRVFRQTGRGEELGLGEMFARVEAEKMKLQIVEYAITPTTLEQIFNAFTKSTNGEVTADVAEPTSLASDAILGKVVAARD